MQHQDSGLSWCLVTTLLGKCLVSCKPRDLRVVETGKFKAQTLCRIISSMQQFSGSPVIQLDMRSALLISVRGGACLVTVMFADATCYERARVCALHILHVFESVYCDRLVEIARQDSKQVEEAMHRYSAETNRRYSMADEVVETAGEFRHFEDVFLKPLLSSFSYKNLWLNPLVDVASVTGAAIFDPSTESLILGISSSHTDSPFDDLSTWRELIAHCEQRSVLKTRSSEMTVARQRSRALFVTGIPVVLETGTSLGIGQAFLVVACLGECRTVIPGSIQPDSDPRESHAPLLSATDYKAASAELLLDRMGRSRELIEEMFGGSCDVVPDLRGQVTSRVPLIPHPPSESIPSISTQHFRPQPPSGTPDPTAIYVSRIPQPPDNTDPDLSAKDVFRDQQQIAGNGSPAENYIHRIPQPPSTKPGNYLSRSVLLSRGNLSSEKHDISNNSNPNEVPISLSADIAESNHVTNGDKISVPPLKFDFVNGESLHMNPDSVRRIQRSPSWPSFESEISEQNSIVTPRSKSFTDLQLTARDISMQIKDVL
eukprot:968623_1